MWNSSFMYTTLPHLKLVGDPIGSISSWLKMAYSFSKWWEITTDPTLYWTGFLAWLKRCLYKKYRRKRQIWITLIYDLCFNSMYFMNDFRVYERNAWGFAINKIPLMKTGNNVQMSKYFKQMFNITQILFILFFQTKIIHERRNTIGVRFSSIS